MEALLSLFPLESMVPQVTTHMHLTKQNTNTQVDKKQNEIIELHGCYYQLWNKDHLLQKGLPSTSVFGTLIS